MNIASCVHVDSILIRRTIIPQHVQYHVYTTRAIMSFSANYTYIHVYIIMSFFFPSSGVINVYIYAYMFIYIIYIYYDWLLYLITM